MSFAERRTSGRRQAGTAGLALIHGAARPGASRGTAWDRPVRNTLLSSLGDGALDRIRPHLKPVDLRRRQVLQERNVPPGEVVFIESGLVSVLARAGDGGWVEVRTLGRPDVVGLPLVLGTERSPDRCIVQVAGTALRMEASALRAVLAESPEIRTHLLAAVQSALVHVAQIAACNARHSLGERLARWLLVARHRLDSDEIEVTHDAVAKALGVQRAGVTRGLGLLGSEGLLRLERRRIIVAPEALQSRSCGCHRAINACSEPVAATETCARAA